MKLWNYLSGKKRTIALLYWSVVIPALPIVFDNGVPADINKSVQIIGLLLSTIGLGHAAAKAINK